MSGLTVIQLIPCFIFCLFAGPYGWIYPLLVILVILLLLFIIIYACAACKRYQHDNYNVAKRE